MIGRVWHGWTSPKKAVVPAAARALLARFDDRSQHYEVRAEISV